MEIGHQFQFALFFRISMASVSIRIFETIGPEKYVPRHLDGESDLDRSTRPDPDDVLNGWAKRTKSVPRLQSYEGRTNEFHAGRQKVV